MASRLESLQKWSMSRRKKEKPIHNNTTSVWWHLWQIPKFIAYSLSGFCFFLKATPLPWLLFSLLKRRQFSCRSQHSGQALFGVLYSLSLHIHLPLQGGLKKKRKTLHIGTHFSVYLFGIIGRFWGVLSKGFQTPPIILIPRVVDRPQKKKDGTVGLPKLPGAVTKVRETFILTFLIYMWHLLTLTSASFYHKSRDQKINVTMTLVIFLTIQSETEF